MKIRQGFVSNSSTSSFIIIGTKITNDVLLKEAMAQKVELLIYNGEFINTFGDYIKYGFSDNITKNSTEEEKFNELSELTKKNEVFGTLLYDSCEDGEYDLDNLLIEKNEFFKNKKITLRTGIMES